MSCGRPGWAPTSKFLNLPRDVFFRYMDARLLFIQDDWVNSRAALEDVRPEMTDNPGLQKQVDFCLGRCYRHAGATDRELAAYRRALEIDSMYAPAHAGAAEVYLGQGKINQAIAEYLQVVKSDHAADETWIELARMLVMKNLRLPAENRDWDEAEQALRDAAEHNPRSPQVPLLAAEVLVAKDRIPQAERLLEGLREKNPEQMDFWIVLASLADRQEEWDKAEKLLNDAKQQLGDKVGLRIARAQHLVRRDGPKAAGQVRDLALKTEKFTPVEQRQLWGGLIGCSLQALDDAQARDLADRVAKDDPGNLPNHFLRFELASHPGRRPSRWHSCGHRKDHREGPDVALRPGGPHQSDGERKGPGRRFGGSQPGFAVPVPSPAPAAKSGLAWRCSRRASTISSASPPLPWNATRRRLSKGSAIRRPFAAPSKS